MSQCSATKNGFVMNTRGEANPCCSGKFSEYSIENATQWNDKRDAEIPLYELSKTGWLIQCNMCRVAELAKNKSARTMDAPFYSTVAEDDNTIKSATINGSNTCNLMCRMCGPGPSSRWGQLVRQNPYNKEYGRPSRILLDASSTLPMLKEKVLTKHLRRLVLAGGEPLLIKWYDDIVQYIVEKGYNEIFVAITTNGTRRLNKKWQAVYKSLDQGAIGFSIDGVGPVFEYIRAGATWDKLKDVVDHTQTVLKDYRGIDMQFAYVAQALNAHTMWDDMDYLSKWFRSYNRRASTNIDENYTLCHYPPQQSYNVICPELRKKYKIEHITETFAYDPELFKQFMQQMAWQDNAHNTHLKDINPDFFDTQYYPEELINAYYEIKG